MFLQPSINLCFHWNVSPFANQADDIVGLSEWCRGRGCRLNKQIHKQTIKSLNLTFLGLRGTRSLSLFIPGIIIVILLGPFIPKTFVSWCHKYIKKQQHFLLVLTLNSTNPEAVHWQMQITCDELLRDSRKWCPLTPAARWTCLEGLVLDSERCQRR